MRTFSFTIAGGLAGLIGGFALGIGIGLLAVELSHAPDVEGGAGMMVVFVIAPMVALVSALIGAVWAGVATSRRARLRQLGELPPRGAWPLKTRIAVGIATGLIVGYAAGLALIQAFDLIRGSHFYTTYAAALVASWIPVLVALVSAALGGWIGGRTRPPTSVA
ncbi:hypothetical protein E8L99_15050 [Phreatobacter aquaticus]|uniref:Uncharacterized protein n=1 Tax=Phreatobacter aquaticus TaxID=2570229 RepID=A0A4D7QGE7_9HYPH|nr:hypothetical protein [Phreatobacter aquaticus]QCK86980.1 hypothetical protein E8L99_15050 [Phreatobacter aquaticus]